MGTTRQTKGRSRTGCKQCRMNRKKCDEARPTCGRCAVRHTQCDFDRPLGVRLGNRSRMRSGLESVHDGDRRDPGDFHDEPESAHTSREPLSSPAYASEHSQEFLLSTPGSLLNLTATPMPNMTATPMPTMTATPLPGLEAVQETDPFHELLQDLFGSSIPDMSASMSLIFAPGGPVQSELAELEAPYFQTARSPNVEPRDVQRRFNAPLDPRAALQNSISPSIVATLSDIDARLFYHYIDVQAPISLGTETEDNPLTKHFIPIALSAALSGRNEDNPAFHALRATAATNRANLMDRTGTDGANVFRDIAQESRKSAYSLLAARIDTLPTATTVEREQFCGALAILVSLAVIDGNTRLLPRLIDAYSSCLHTKLSNLSVHEEFCIVATHLWQTWFNFTLTMAHNQAPLAPLCEGLNIQNADADNIFAVTPSIAAEHMRVYRLIHAYRNGGPSSALSTQLEADELITRYGRSLERDLESRALRDPESAIAQRTTIGSLVSANDCVLLLQMHHAALRVLLLREVFQCPDNDVQIHEDVRHALNLLPSVKWGTEAGLLIPLVILSTAARGHDRHHFRNFMLRLCWKGSAGPQAALRTLDTVIETGAGWKKALARMGSVILV